MSHNTPSSGTRCSCNGLSFSPPC